MYCSQCGTQNDDNAWKCVQCGAPLAREAEPTFHEQVNIPNYLVHAILVTVCCCQPFGIVAIVYAAQVNSKIAGGDIAGAQQASDTAKMWCWVGFGFGLFIQLVAMAVYGSVFLARAGWMR